MTDRNIPSNFMSECSRLFAEHCKTLKPTAAPSEFELFAAGYEAAKRLQSPRLTVERPNDRCINCGGTRYMCVACAGVNTHETTRSPEAIVRAVQLDRLATYLQSHQFDAMAESARESAKLLRDFAGVSQQETNPSVWPRLEFGPFCGCCTRNKITLGLPPDTQYSPAQLPAKAAAPRTGLLECPVAGCVIQSPHVHK